MCETKDGDVVIARTWDADEGYHLACSLQADGHNAWMQEEVMA